MTATKRRARGAQRKGTRRRKTPSQPARRGTQPLARLLEALRTGKQRLRARVPPVHQRLLLGLALLALVLSIPLGVLWPGLAAWSRGWFWAWGWTTPLLLALLAYAGLHLLLPHRVPWHPARGLGILAAWLGLSGWLHLALPGSSGRWGALWVRLLDRALGRAGTYVVLSVGMALAVVWLWNRPLWPVLRQAGNRLRHGVARLPRYGTALLTWLRERRARRRARAPSLPAPAAPPGMRPLVLRPRRRAGEAPAPRHTPEARGTPSPQAAEAAPAEHPRPWRLPSWEALLDPASEAPPAREAWAREQARIIEETLAHFGVPARVVAVQHGPTVTLFGVEPGYVTTKKGRTRVRVAKILALADDLALALAAKRLRIQAPVPGRPYVGIEVPNEQPVLVPLRRVLASKAFREQTFALPLALGEDVSGQAVVAGLERMPHLLIAGATGSGKSVCLQTMLVTWLLTRTPDQVRFLLIDPKRVELTRFNGIPHLMAPLVTDLEKAQAVLQWALEEMDRRYRALARVGARSLDDYNRKAEARGERPFPRLVIVIDELADLMMLAPHHTEQALVRLAQLARATGIHLVVATQRPSVDVVTGLIKANFPARIAFAVASAVDSRVILDRPGAERLLGRGDMLFLPPDAPEPRRVQGAFITEAELRRVVQYWLAQAPPQYGRADVPRETLTLQRLEGSVHPPDPLLEAARDLVQREGRVSVSLLQRHLGIGYTRAARLVEQLRARGWVPTSENASSQEPERPYNEGGETTAPDSQEQEGP